MKLAVKINDEVADGARYPVGHMAIPFLLALTFLPYHETARCQTLRDSFYLHEDKSMARPFEN